jgi:ABC-type sugar transport system permease subunit
LFNIYSLQFPIKSYQQWQNYQETLHNSGLITKITINTLSFDAITVSVEYNGKTSFSEFLNSFNFEFQKLNDIYFITPKP